MENSQPESWWFDALSEQELVTMFALHTGMLSDNKTFLTMSRQDWAFLHEIAAARRKDFQKIQRNLDEITVVSDANTEEPQLD